MRDLQLEIKARNWAFNKLLRFHTFCVANWLGLSDGRGIDDTKIDELESFKFLGILRGKGLTWNDCVNSECIKSIYYLRSVACLFPHQILMAAYYSFVFPHGVALWEDALVSSLNFTRVLRLKKLAVRTITTLPDCSLESRAALHSKTWIYWLPRTYILMANCIVYIWNQRQGYIIPNWVTWDGCLRAHALTSVRMFYDYQIP